ncbi:hypothetical protein BJY24_000958 [Nocardia transvalensis]|uniref:Uncharacterized protein n=1 Tax=Nocardia transvalensis TaxID=37333 RepID=A0A7W9UGH4_9NOCA|nr:DUF3159 domain-containing protein [Nocardia transvalensis]MBB5912091.1 hypothetical protein [Nocardia transvalensis]
MESIDQQRPGAAELWGKFRAVGGVRHLVDGAAPAVGFLVGYATVNAKAGVLIALLTPAWFVFWAVHLVIMVPLYVANEVVLLGSVALVLGKPALVVMIGVTWLWVRRSLRAA